MGLTWLFNHHQDPNRPACVSDETNRWICGVLGLLGNLFGNCVFVEERKGESSWFNNFLNLK